MKDRKVWFTRLLAVSLALGFLLALPGERVQGRGFPWVIEVKQPARNDGQAIIDIEVDSIRICTTIPVKKDWSVQEKCEEIAKVLDKNKFLTVTCNGNRIKIVANDPNEIKSVQITEIGTGEGLTAVKDDPLQEELILRAYFCLKGMGENGEANLRIGDEPLVTVSTTGLKDVKIGEALVSTFNDIYEGTGYKAQHTGAFIYIDNVPCPLGIAAGTTDTNLSFSLGMAPMEVSVEELVRITEERLSTKNCGGDPPIYGDIMVFPTPERYLGTDLNGDNDTFDTVLRYQNLETGHVFNTGLVVSGAYHATDIFENIIVFVGEDSHICYYDINTNVVRDVGVKGSYTSIYGDIVVFASNGTVCYYDLENQVLVNTKMKGSSPSIYEDLIVFRSYSPKSTICIYNIRTGNAIDTNISGWHTAIYEKVIAFTTLESSAEEDMNGDGDTNDCVVRYYNLETQTVTSTNAVGRYPSFYRNRIVFSTPERDVNLDLNGDGKIMGSVIRYYDVQIGRVINTQKLGTEPDIYGDTITSYMYEQWVDQDLNHDGDLRDTIVDTYQIRMTEMIVAGPGGVLILALLVISGTTAYFRRR